VRIAKLFCLVLVTACAPGPHSLRIDPALATLVPADAIALAGIRIDKLTRSPLYRDLRPLLDTNLVSRLTRRTGRRLGDLWELLAVATPEDIVWMARGRFSASGIEPRLTWPGARRATYRNHLFISDARQAVSFMNASTALAGRPERIKAIIDQRDSEAAPPADLLALAGEIDDSAQIWAVVLGGRKPPPGVLEPLRRLLEDILPKIERARAAVKVGETLALNVEAECRNLDDAETLRSAANAFLGFTRLQRNEGPALREALDRLSVQREGALVKLTVELPAPLVKKLLPIQKPAS